MRAINLRRFHELGEQSVAIFVVDTVTLRFASSRANIGRGVVSSKRPGMEEKPWNKKEKEKEKEKKTETKEREK